MSDKNTASWIVVTGATGGIGKELLAKLVGAGRRVVALARHPERIVMPAGPGRVERVAWDAERPDTFAATVEAITQVTRAEGIGALVNLAGVIVEGPLEALTPQDVRRQFEINVVAPFALTLALLPLLKRTRGRVVNIGAISAHLTPPFYGPIAASKAALSALNDAMRLEFAQFGIRVVLIEPGAMKTEIFATARAARDATIAKSREVERHYRPALAAMDRAFEKAGADDPAVVVAAIERALFARSPRPELVVGKGSGAFVLLSRLPTRLRDRLVKSALGVGALLKSAI